MANNEPVTIWSGAGAELTLSNNPNIDTEASLDLLSEAGLNLVSDDTTRTGKPLTVWTSNDSL